MIKFEIEKPREDEFFAIYNEKLDCFYGTGDEGEPMFISNIDEAKHFYDLDRAKKALDPNTVIVKVSDLGDHYNVEEIDLFAMNVDLFMESVKKSFKETLEPTKDQIEIFNKCIDNVTLIIKTNTIPQVPTESVTNNEKVVEESITEPEPKEEVQENPDSETDEPTLKELQDEGFVEPEQSTPHVAFMPEEKVTSIDDVI